MLSTLFNSAIILLSLSTATGVLLHDTHIDKAAAVGLSTPAIMAYDANTKMASLGNDLHPHHERSAMEQSIRNFTTQNPRVQPRVLEDKKHLMQKYTMRGHHAFDNYNLPLV
jgi:hypothetical protein